MIWGVLIVLLGLAIIVKAVFHLDVPIFRLIFGLVLVYLGVQLIVGWHRWRWFPDDDGATVLFARREIVLTPGQMPERTYTVAFGRTLLDLRALAPAGADLEMDVNVVFGDAVIRINPASPVEVEANVAFGRAELPDRSQVVLGRHLYRSESAAGAPYRVRIKSSVAFGSLQLQRD